MPEMLDLAALAAAQRDVLAGNTEAPAGSQETTSQTGEQAPAAKPSDALKRDPGEPREITLNDGRKVTLQKPKGLTALIVSRALGLDSSNPMLDTYYRAVMWVQAVNGLAIPQPLRNGKQIEAVCELLGDEALEEVVAEVFSDRVAAIIEGGLLKNS